MLSSSLFLLAHGRSGLETADAVGFTMPAARLFGGFWGSLFLASHSVLSVECKISKLLLHNFSVITSVKMAAFKKLASNLEINSAKMPKKDSVVVALLSSPK